MYLINFTADDGPGIVIVRNLGNRIGLCVSLEDDGDAEAFLTRHQVEQLIEALRTAMTITPDP